VFAELVGVGIVRIKRKENYETKNLKNNISSILAKIRKKKKKCGWKKPTRIEQK